MSNTGDINYMVSTGANTTFVLAIFVQSPYWCIYDLYHNILWLVLCMNTIIPYIFWSLSNPWFISWNYPFPDNVQLSFIGEQYVNSYDRQIVCWPMADQAIVLLDNSGDTASLPLLYRL